MTNINLLRPSVSSLFLSFSFNGRELAKGTGFIVETKKNAYLITNRHNVTGRNNFTGDCLREDKAIPNEVNIWHNKKTQLGSWVKKTEALLEDDRHKWIEHPTLKGKADFVALPLTQLDDVQLYPYELKIEENELLLQPTDILRVVGFPLGMSSSGSGMVAIWVTGFVASEPVIDYDGLPAFLIDCRARNGQSGSPVIFHANAGSSFRDGDQLKVVTKGSITMFLGIYSGRIHRDSDIGIVWKKSAIIELIQSVT